MLNLTCKNCQISKPTDSFYINPAYKTGYRPVCKECLKLKYPSKYEKKPPEYFEERRRIRDREKQELKQKLLVERDMRKELERPAKEAASKEKKKIQKREYRRKKRSEPYARRVEKINDRCSGLGKLSNGIIKKLLIQQDCKCVYCKIDISANRHVDHIVPLALGGLNVDSNVQLTCPECNIKKADLPPWLYPNA